MSFVNFITKSFTGVGSDNTPEGSLIRTGGKHVTKTITLSANNTSANVNVFQLTGTVRVLSLNGEVLSATTLNNCTNVYFDLWDGTNSAVITDSVGANMSGFGVGSFFLKDGDSTVDLHCINNNQGRISEGSTGNRIFQEFILTQKISTNTYIRFNYTTTDEPINAQLKIDITYADIDSGNVTAV